MNALPIALPNLTATENLAKRFAPLLRAGDVVGLEGALGAGKTAFARALLQALGVTGEVPSPTFTLVQVYDLPDFTACHFDLYRLRSADELDELGWDEALSDGIALVEWPERADGRLPEDALILRFAVEGAGRSCAVIARGNWAERLKGWP